MPKVINIRQAPSGWQNNPEYVYIGRAGKGLSGYFGNPVSKRKTCPECGKIHNDNGSTLSCYTRYLRRRLKEPRFKQAVKSLKNKTLVCFCKPKPCHGDISRSC